MMVTDTVTWGSSTIELTFERWDSAFDSGDVSSVRAIVLAGDNVLVVTNEHEMHVIPGGRPQGGETHDDALRRELLEETGWSIESAVPLGRLRGRHMTPMPEGYRHPYPEFLQKIYVAWADRFTPEAKHVDDYERLAEFRPISTLAPSELLNTQWAMLQAAARVPRPPPVTRDAHWDGPGLDAWQPWSPQEAAAALDGLAVPWCVVGGWAIDLSLGRTTRSHADIEVATLRTQFAHVREHLRAYKLHVAGDGEVRALPATEVPPAEHHQVWVLDPVADAWRMDVMLEGGDGQTWVFRRDVRITALRSEMVSSRDGIPYLRPEGVLLFKAKALRDKDEADFTNCLSHLGRSGRAWLAGALEIAHPGHPWIERLRRESA